jgi:hypothetical protein
MHEQWKRWDHLKETILDGRIILKRVLNICKIWLRIDANHFLLNEAINVTLYICRTMTNVQLALLKLLYFSCHIQIIPTYIREHSSSLTCSTHRRFVCIFRYHSQKASFCLLFSELYTVVLAATLYRAVLSAHLFSPFGKLWNIEFIDADIYCDWGRYYLVY